VRVGTLTCALPSGSVQRVRRGLKIYPVPGSNPHLFGLTQSDGEPLAVLDLLRLLDGEAQIESAQPLVVVVTAGPQESSETIGLAVDEALEVAVVPDGAITAASSGGLVCGTASVDDGSARVLDLSTLGKGG
jgi:chemotaxis signal transduction protein